MTGLGPPEDHAGGAAELHRQLDLASEENARLLEHREHWMGETEALQDALARSDRGKARLESENAQLRRELKKVRSTLDELLERFQTAVRTARRFAGMLFSSSSERLGGSAETVVSEVELDCPAFIWDDDPTGGLAGGGAANGEAVDPLPEERAAPRPRKRGRPRGATGGRKIGKDVPTITCHLEPEAAACPSCGGERKTIRTEAAERVHYVPASYVRVVIERPVLGCARCRHAAPEQAPAPDWLIPRGLPTEALLAHTMASKFQDHFPSYRLSQRLARHGILIGDATLNSWIARGFEILQPLYDAIKAHVLSADRLFLDETTVKFLEPGFGKARTGYLWAALRDDRTFAGPAPPAALFWSGPGRGKAIPEAMLRDFAGLAQVDRYAAYNILADPARPAGPVFLQFCMTHWRRKFHYLTESRFRNEALARIGKLFAIEKPILFKHPDERLRVRQLELKPAFEQWKAFLEAAASRLPEVSAEAAAIRYGLADGVWPGFIRLLDDGRLDLHSNRGENAHRPVKLTMRNSLFAGSENAIDIWARANTLITTCRLNNVDPEAWLTHVLVQIRDGCKDVESLMPWQPFKPPGDQCLAICGTILSPEPHAEGP